MRDYKGAGSRRSRSDTTVRVPPRVLLMIGIALGVVILAALWMLAPSGDKAPAAEPVGRSDGAIPLTLPPPDASSEAATTP